MAKVTQQLIEHLDQMLKKHRFVKLNADGSLNAAPNRDIVLEDGEQVFNRAQFNGYQGRGWPAEF